MKANKIDVRPPAVAGMFYPAQKDVLSNNVARMLQQAIPKIKKQPSVIGVVAPHAGYIYSGPVAAAAYGYLNELTFDTVIIISPSHYDYFNGISVFPGHYQTPLGVIENNIAFSQALLDQSEEIMESSLGHGREHGIEVHLPFLQKTIKEFTIVPLVMGNQNWEMASLLSQALQYVLQTEPFKKQKTLIVASSDLSHFYNQSRANKLDKVFVDSLAKNDPRLLYENIANKSCEACGFAPVISTMLTLNAAIVRSVKITSYGTSGDLSGDYQRVVGYTSCIFY